MKGARDDLLEPMIRRVEDAAVAAIAAMYLSSSFASSTARAAASWARRSSALAGIRIFSPIVVCNNDHRFLVREELARAHVDPQMILLEPVARNTAAASVARARSSPPSASRISLLSTHRMRCSSRTKRARRMSPGWWPSSSGRTARNTSVKPGGKHELDRGDGLVGGGPAGRTVTQVRVSRRSIMQSS